MPDMTDEEEERIEPTPHVAANIKKIAEFIEPNAQVHKAEEKAQKAASDLGNLYQKMEKDFHGNRAAIKAVRKLVAGTVDAAYDYMRTFMRLADHFGLIPEDDLVDMMGSRSEPEAPKDDGIPSVSAADKAPKVKTKPRPISGKNALDRVREQMATGGRPPAPDGPEGDTDFVEAAEEVAASRSIKGGGGEVVNLH